jgi:GDP-mannose 4,6-dehydratase
MSNAAFGRTGHVMTKRALITGITGQDGSYLAEYLLAEGYEVWGLVRGQTEPQMPLAPDLRDDVRFVRGDLLDRGSLISTIEEVEPDEVYNLGAISYVPLSWNQAEITAEVTGVGVLRTLEAIRIVSGARASQPANGRQIRFYQASSSEMFGKVRETPQNELTQFHPRSPYGVAKAYGHHITQNFRESYGMHASSGILFNHESPHRGPEFVTRKVTLAVARIKLGMAHELRLGNNKTHWVRRRRLPRRPPTRLHRLGRPCHGHLTQPRAGLITPGRNHANNPNAGTYRRRPNQNPSTHRGRDQHKPTLTFPWPTGCGTRLWGNY